MRQRRLSTHIFRWIRVFICTFIVATASPITTLADEAEPEGCCVCDCTERATTSGGAPPGAPEGSICIETSSAACANVCDLEGCIVNFFEPIECSAVIGCPNAGAMAPTVSPLALGFITLGLATLGIAAVRRRTS